MHACTSARAYYDKMTKIYMLFACNAADLFHLHSMHLHHIGKFVATIILIFFKNGALKQQSLGVTKVK